MAKRGKKEQAEQGGEGQPTLATTSTFEQLYPRLAWELLSRTWGDGRTGREPGGLSIFQQDGTVKGALRERNMGQVAFRSSATVDGLLRGFNDALESGSLDWREDKFARKS